MKSKIFFSFAITFISILAFQDVAHCIPTKWETVNVSLSDLLKSGWQLSGIASNRVYQRNSFSPGGIDEETYTFSLIKNNDHIICAVANPTNPVAKNAICIKIS
jgi:hypothetical protein